MAWLWLLSRTTHLYDFRDRLAKVIETLHIQLVKNAIAQRHTDPTVLALDGTSIAACASRHRMVTKDTLQKRQRVLAQVREGLWPQDQELPKWVPPTPSGRDNLYEEWKSLRTRCQHESQRMRQNQAINGKIPPRSLLV